MDESTYDKTIEERQADLKQKFIEAIAEIPVIEVACKKAGFGRTTHHRWIKEDEDFRRRSDEAVALGRERINDMSEAQIIQLIKKEKLPAIALWLKHNSPRYGGKAVRGPVTATPELSVQEEKLLKEALAMSSGREIRKTYHAKNQPQKSEEHTGESEAS